MGTETADRAKRGLSTGAVAFVVGLIATRLVEGHRLSGSDAVVRVSTGDHQRTLTFADLEAPSTTHVAGWLHQEAHLTPVEVHWIGAPAEVGRAEATFLLDPSPATMLVPPLVLGGAAWWLVRRASPESLREAVWTAAYVVNGYAPLALASAPVFNYHFTALGARFVAQPPLPTAVLVTGLLYPALVATVVAVPTYLLSVNRADEAPTAG